MHSTQSAYNEIGSIVRATIQEIESDGTWMAQTVSNIKVEATASTKTDAAWKAIDAASKRIDNMIEARHGYIVVHKNENENEKTQPNPDLLKQHDADRILEL